MSSRHRTVLRVKIGRSSAAENDRPCPSGSRGTGGGGEMGTKDKQEHQPEPWTQDGRYILDASGWTLASARFPGDARRIIAAVNSVQGIPTDALESWVVNVIGEPVGAADVDRRAVGSSLPEPVPNERRVGE